MKLEINTNGSWRTVLRGLSSYEFERIRGATETLCDVAYQRGAQIKFRQISNDGDVAAYCDSKDCVWVPAMERAGKQQP